MSSNSIYFQEWTTTAHSKMRLEIYPLAKKVGTNTTLPAFESRYVQLPSEALLSVGNISAKFELLPMGVAETGTFQTSINLSNLPAHLRERLLANQDDSHPPVWAIFIAPDGINWERRALFVGVQKRVPSMRIGINGNGDEIADFDVVDIFRYCFEYIKLDDATLLDLCDAYYYRADRIYDYAVTEVGNKLHSDFAMGGSPAHFYGTNNDHYRHSAWMLAMNEFLSCIRATVDSLFQRLFCQSTTASVFIDFTTTQQPHAHKRVTLFFNHATTLANTISVDPSTSDLHFIAKITERLDNTQILGGELYDKKDGLLKLGNCYDFFKAYCENFACKLSYWIDATPNTSGVPTLHIKTLGAFEGIAYNHDYVDEVAKVMTILNNDIAVEVGTSSIRSARAIVQNAAELDVNEYEVKLTGAESERDYDVLLYFHNHPTNADSGNRWKPGVRSGVFDRTAQFPNPDLADGYSDAPSSTMNSAFDFFPYSKVYHKFQAETLPWADDAPRFDEPQAYYFIKPAENVTIDDTMFTQDQVATTHPAISKTNGGFWTDHKTLVQIGSTSRVGLGFCLADYVTKVFGSTSNMVLSCSTTNVFLFDLGKRIRSNATTLDLQDFGFSYETTSLAYSADSNTANAITGVDFDVKTGVSKVTVFIKGAN